VRMRFSNRNPCAAYITPQVVAGQPRHELRTRPFWGTSRGKKNRR
jgi:hypothetical protein